MKTIFKYIAISFAALMPATGVFAQEGGAEEENKKKLSVSFGTDLVSSYVWRGFYNAGASIQPSASLKINGFSATAWGSVDFAASDYKELDLTLAYSVAGFTFSVVDYYWTGAPNESIMPDRNYFHFGADTPHRVEVGVGYCFGEKFPLTLSWNTMVLGRDKNEEGGQNFSTYAEISYPFSIKTVDVNTWVGFTPWETPGTYGTTGFAVCNVGVGLSKSIQVSKMISLPIFTRLIWNPAKQDAHFVGGFGILL